MDWGKTSLVVIAIAVVIVLLYDAMAASFGGTGDTVSGQLWLLSHSYPAIPFFTGLLCGHIFIPAMGSFAPKTEKKDEK
jgi:ABC-type dipeptide/oligopeptide/nickel transport system permease subunit